MVARPVAGGGRRVDVGPERLARWIDGFAGRHGAFSSRFADGRLVLTAENHTVVGGLFESVASALVQRGVAKKVAPIGLPDAFLDAGALPTLHDRYGLSTDAVVARAPRRALEAVQQRLRHAAVRVEGVAEDVEEHGFAGDAV